jgi:hypothetical protein
MPDQRRHRGAHPEDRELFAPKWHAALRAAVADFSWLLSRDYAGASALKVVGDRYGLSARQRTAVMRSACSDSARASRLERETPLSQIARRPLWIDGYNVLTSVEAALAGGVIIVGRDGCWRDMASMHGTWRRVEETRPAIGMVGEMLERVGAAAEVVWFLDAPVSNSGRLKAAIMEIAGARGWTWQVEVVPDPDKVLRAAQGEVVASADSAVLDQCAAWVALAREVVRGVPGARVVEMS